MDILLASGKAYIEAINSIYAYKPGYAVVLFQLGSRRKKSTANTRELHQENATRTNLMTRGTTCMAGDVPGKRERK